MTSLKYFSYTYATLFLDANVTPDIMVSVYVIIYYLAHSRESQTLLYPYFMDAGVPEHLYSDKIWQINKNIKCQQVLYDEGWIKVSQTEPFPPFHNNAKRAIQQSQTLLIRQRM